MESQKCQRVIKMEVDHLYTDTHMLRAARLVEEYAKRLALSIANRVKSLSQLRGESSSLAG